MLYDRCRIPTIGVIPFRNFDIEDEDSMAERLLAGRKPDLIDIAVIHLPHISNFTDFNPLQNIENVSLRYVATTRELGAPDLIILPGTKNTMHDLQWMRDNGLEQKICRLVRDETSMIIGICGGFQMLGREIQDPLSVEQGGSMKGMGLMNLRTSFQEMKVRSRVKGRLFPIKGVFESLSECTFTGYEIHMGRTEALEKTERFSEIIYLDESGEAMDGYVSGNRMGTYVHGIFEDGTLRNHLLQLLFDRKGLIWQGKRQMSYLEYKNSQYDLLADAVRENTDMKAVYHMIGIR